MSIHIGSHFPASCDSTRFQESFARDRRIATIERLYALFSKFEVQFMQYGTGPFADPLCRAFGYLNTIDQLLRHGFDNKMAEGMPISMKRFCLAVEKHREAEDRGVWEPYVSFDGLDRCRQYKAEVERMIAQARENLSAHEIDMVEVGYEADGDDDDDSLGFELQKGEEKMQYRRCGDGSKRAKIDG